jgi:altered-inheritance-of-mitochondria protein 13
MHSLQSYQLNNTLTRIPIQQLPRPVLLQPSGCPPIHFRGKSTLSETTQNTTTNSKPFQTDSSRTKAIELEIQKRVAQELERLHAREKQTLAEIEKKLSEVKDSALPVTAATAPIASSSSGYPAGSLNLDAPRVPFAGREHEPSPVFTAPAAAPQAVAKRDISRDSVASEIEQLRSRLDGRRKLAELDEGVEKAKADVVGCLRLNDRRPLDCWQEVDAFKREVAKMEQAFVDRIVG